MYVESAISAYDGRGFQNVAVGHINGVPQEKMRSHGVLCARINEVWAWFDVWTFRRDKKNCHRISEACIMQGPTVYVYNSKFSTST